MRDDIDIISLARSISVNVRKEERKISLIPPKYQPLKETILSLFRGYTDAPDRFLEGAYWFIVSTLYGYYTVIIDAPKIRANTWILLSGKSAITRKSTVINLAADEFIRRSMYSYYRTLMPELPESEIYRLVDGMFISQGSTEGVLQHFEDILEAYPNMKRFILYSHEFGGVLRGLREVAYMSQLGILLSSLYYGERKILRFVKGTRELPEGVYSTALLGIQQLDLYVDALYFKQGLMRRFFVIYQRPEDKNRWYGILKRDRTDILYTIREVAREIGEYLATTEETIKRIFGMREFKIRVDLTDPAIELINDFNKRLETEAMHDSTLFSYYIPALVEYAVKFAVLNALVEKPVIISEITVNNRREVASYIVVDEKDAEKAIEFVDEVRPRAREIILSVEIPRKNMKLLDISPVSKLIADKIEELLKKRPEKLGLSIPEIAVNTKMPIPHLVEPLFLLASSGKIVAFREKEGNRVKVYITTNNRSNSIDPTKIITPEELRRYMVVVFGNNQL